MNELHANNDAAEPSKKPVAEAHLHEGGKPELPIDEADDDFDWRYFQQDAPKDFKRVLGCGG